MKIVLMHEFTLIERRSEHTILKNYLPLRIGIFVKINRKEFVGNLSKCEEKIRTLNRRFSLTRMLVLFESNARKVQKVEEYKDRDRNQYVTYGFG